MTHHTVRRVLEALPLAGLVIVAHTSALSSAPVPELRRDLLHDRPVIVRWPDGIVVPTYPSQPASGLPAGGAVSPGTTAPTSPAQVPPAPVSSVAAQTAVPVPVPAPGQALPDTQGGFDAATDAPPPRPAAVLSGQQSSAAQVTPVTVP